MTRLFLGAAMRVVAMQLILTGSAFAQNWIWLGGPGNWGNSSFWMPPPNQPSIPNSETATATFNAVTGTSPTVSLTGGPFQVGTLNLTNDVNGGFIFQNGTLQLANSPTINVQGHNTSPDFDTTTGIFLQSGFNTNNTLTINTVFSDSTLTVASTINSSSSGFSLTKIGPGTLTLSNLAFLGGGTIVNGGTLKILNGGNIEDSVFGLIGNGSIIGNGSSGTVTVDGAGSNWTSGSLAVGNSGPGTLSIQNGGTVSDSDGIIGNGSSGTVTVTAAGSIWTNSSTLTISNLGPGTLAIENGGAVSNADGVIAGTVTASGTVTVTGAGSTWTNNGALTVGEFGPGALTIQNGGLVSNADGIIAGSAGSNGTVTVNGAGSTWTSGGTLTVGEFGPGTVTIENGGAVSNADGIIAGSAGSNGTVTVSGAGSAWTNNGTLTVGEFGPGTLTIQNGGVVSNADGVMAGFNGSSATVTVKGAGSAWTNSGSLAVGNSGMGILSIQDGGRVSNTEGVIGGSTDASGVVAVSGASSTWTNSSTLTVGDFGTGTLTIQNGGVVSNADGVMGGFNGSSATVTVKGAGSAWTNSGSLAVGNSGMGILNIQDGGRVSNTEGVIGGSAGARGAVTVSGAGSTWTSGALFVGGNRGGPGGVGLLQISDGGTVNAAATTIWNSGTLAFGASFRLNSPLIFSGGTVRAVADATFANDATLAAGGAVIDSNGFNSTFTGALSGSGGITKINPGTVRLTGANTYSGGTILSVGTLMVGSPHALGTGNVVVKGGVLTTDPQVINVAGNYTQTGGTLLLHVGGANVGQYDSLSVGGQASLGGTLQLVALNGFRLTKGDQLTLVTANGGIQGKFTSLIDPFTSNTVLQPGLVYGSDNVILELLFSSFVPFALTTNQQAVAQNLDSVVSDSRAAPLIDFLTNEPITNLPVDFDQIAPADLTSLYEASFSGANIQRLNLTNRMEEIREGATGFSSRLSVNRQQPPMDKDGKGVVEEQGVLQSSPDNRWGVFASGAGDFVSVGGDGNASGYDFTTAGVTLGVDYRVTKNLAIGLMGGYAHTWTDLARDGDVDVNTGKAGLYATWWDRGFYLNGFAGGGFNSYEARRGALQGFATGTTDGSEFDTFADIGYDATIGNWRFGPFGTLAYTYVDLDGYTEHGSLAPLNIVSQHQDSLRTDFGFRAEYRINVGQMQLRPNVRVAWEHEYLYSALPIDARLASGAGEIFTVFGPSEGQDSAIIGAGLTVQLTQKLLLSVDYDGQVGRTRYDSHAVIGALRWSF